MKQWVPIPPLRHDCAELDSALHVRLLGFLKQISASLYYAPASSIRDLLREVGFELEHGAGGQKLEGPEIL